jgi:hypothetical protein
MSVHGHRYKVLKDLSLGIDFDAIIKDFYDELYELQYNNLELESQNLPMPLMEIERLLTYLFKLDDLSAKIPEHF